MTFSYIMKKVIEFSRKNSKVIKKLGKLKCGTRVAFGKRVDIITRKNGKIIIGNGSSIAQYSYISTVGGNIIIGKNVTMNRNVTIVCHEKISIGNSCSLGPGVTIYNHDHKFGKTGRIKGFNKSEVFIGENCWIGANVIILRGTRIGRNCVIGAGCVVKGEIPDNTLVTQSRELILQPLK